MEINVGWTDFFRIGFKYIGYKVSQYRLTTNETHIVQTTHGKVKGVKRITVYDQFYYSFEGIPFAKPPLGELRFKAPQPVEPWEGVRDCTKPGSKPLQKNLVTGMKEGSEDCLYLNIYCKEMKTDKPLPVMVWIFGGGFQIGEASRDMFSPDYFMEKDIVLIAISYRLGALGFLSLSDPELNVPGNAGLKDQLMALQWIKENCICFNGDPDNITLFGESAGGASTHYLMLTEKAEGLFHKAIIMSGNALCPWAGQLENDWAYRLAQYLGYYGKKNEKIILGYLSGIDASRLVGVEDNLKTEEEKSDFVLFPFAPIVEPYISESCIVAVSPKEMMRNAWSNKIPLLIGCTSFEGLLLHTAVKNSPGLMDSSNGCTNLLPLELNLPRDSERRQQLGELLEKTHFVDDASEKDRFLPFLHFLSCKTFLHGMHHTLLSRTCYANGAATFLYRFDYDSPDFNLSRLLLCGKEMRGVAHGDDLLYLFHTFASWKLPKDSPDYLTIQRMIDIFTTFAETSDPNCESTNPLLWTPVEQQTSEEPFKCMNIGNCIEFIDLPEHSKLQVWDSIYRREDLF